MASPSASPPQAEEFFAELNAWTRRQDWPLATHRYGDGDDQLGELRLPAEGEGWPVAIVVHGGFWRTRFDRETTAAIAVALAQAGWASWNVEYRRLGNGGGIPVTLEDVGAATDLLLGMDLPIDRARAVAIGHSSGGHLALWLAGTGRVAAAVGLAGICDLEHAVVNGLGEGAALELAGGTPAERPKAYDEADPMRRLPTGIPQLLVHGAADDRVAVEYSRRYRSAALAAGDRCELLEPENADHFNLVDPRSDAWAAAAAGLDRLLAELG